MPNKTIYDLQSPEIKIEAAHYNYFTKFLNQSIFRTHRNLFYGYLVIGLTHVGIGVASIFNKKSSLVGHILGFVFGMIGVLIVYSLLKNKRTFLRYFTVFGLAYSMFWFLVFILSTLIVDSTEFLWTIPLWGMFAIIHLIALAEPPYQELTQKDGQ